MLIFKCFFFSICVFYRMGLIMFSFIGSLSEEGLLVYLRVLQSFLSQLPVSMSGTDCQDSASDSEDEEISKMSSMPVSSLFPVLDNIKIFVGLFLPKTMHRRGER